MNLAPVFKQRFFDGNGSPLAGGLLYSYAAGTTTPQGTYADATGTANTNPVVCDSQGYADVWLDPTLAYKLVLKDSGGSTLWTEDSVQVGSSGITLWNANQTYSQGALVQDASGQGMLYVSLINANLNKPLTDVSSWRVFGGNLRTVSTNTTLTVTDEFVRSVSTSGNLTHTLPPCASTPIGKRITIKDIGNGGFTTSVKGSGTDLVDEANTFIIPLVQNQSVTVENTGSVWNVIQSFTGFASVTTQLIASNAVTRAKLAAVGQQVSASSGAFTMASTAFADVTNLSVSIATTGRPVFIGFISDGTQDGSDDTYPKLHGLGGSIGSSTYPGTILRILRGATVVATQEFLAINGSNTMGSMPPYFIDVPAAGSYTYKAQIRMRTSSMTSSCLAYVQLIAYEL